MDACLSGELHIFSTFMFPLWLILATQLPVRHLSSRRNVRQASFVCRKWTPAIWRFEIKSTLCYRTSLQNKIVSLSWLMGINQLLMKITNYRRKVLCRHSLRCPLAVVIFLESPHCLLLTTVRSCLAAAQPWMQHLRGQVLLSPLPYWVWV